MAHLASVDLLISTAYQASFDKNICESDEWRKRRVFLFKAKFFPKISESKMGEGNFIGGQIKQIFTDHDFGTKLNAAERQTERHLKTSAETF